jgi:hypothetical protein
MVLLIKILQIADSIMEQIRNHRIVIMEQQIRILQIIVMELIVMEQQIGILQIDLNYFMVVLYQMMELIVARNHPFLNQDSLLP